jgi:hypothetical protein
VHAGDARESAKKPLEHSTHVCGVAAPTAEDEVPRGQDAQVDDRADALYLPAGQAGHVVAPGRGLCEPAGQSVHTEDVVAAGTVDMVPAGHLVHVDDAGEAA